MSNQASARYQVDGAPVSAAEFIQTLSDRLCATEQLSEQRGRWAITAEAERDEAFVALDAAESERNEARQERDEARAAARRATRLPHLMDGCSCSRCSTIRSIRDAYPWMADEALV